MISIQGTGFDSGVVLGTLGFLGILVWSMRGAPVGKRGDNAVGIIWILIIGAIAWVLFFAPPPSEGSDIPDADAEIRIEDGPIDEHEFGGTPDNPGTDAPKPAWSGTDVTLPAIIGICILFAAASGRGTGEGGSRAILIPVLLCAGAVAGVAHAASGIEADFILPPGKWRVPFLTVLCFASIIAALIAAIRRERSLIIGGFIFVALISGVYVVRAIPEASAGVIGGLFESHGAREIREAQAERIRAEARIASLRAELDAERQRALLAASAIRPVAPTASGRESSGAIALGFAFGIALFALGIAYAIERRKRESMERAFSEMRFRLAIAENSRRPDSEFSGTFRMPRLEFQGLARKGGAR